MNTAGPSSWSQLLDGCFAGDAAAREALARRFYPAVCERVHRELQGDFRRRHPWMLAVFSTGDVVQEVFLAVLESLTGGDFADEDAFVAYLSTMVSHRLVDAVRHHEAQRRDVRRQSADETLLAARADGRLPAPALAAQLAEQADVLRQVLEGFDPRRRMLLTMRLVDETPYAEIASQLGYASAETARQSFVDAQARLLVRLRARGMRPPGETVR